MITSPHNEQLKEIRKLARRARRASDAGRVRRRGRGPARGRRRGRLAGARALRRGGQRARRATEVEPELLAQRLRRSARARARSASTSSAGRAPAGPLCVCLWGVGDPGQRRHGAALGARRSAPRSVALGPGCADPFGAEGGARAHGRGLRGRRSRASRDVAELPGQRVALDAARRRAAARPGRRRDVTLLVGAERDGLPQERASPAATRVAHIPIAAESLNAAMAATRRALRDDRTQARLRSGE